jgi:hypothetical protein
MTGFEAAYEPGQFVRHPARPDWGLGQVQSAVGPRVTVNFEHAGKILINTEIVALQVQDEPGGPA